jgi:metal-responsive CopG/Arc/MetJ family transcriptional regulator
MPSDNPKVQMYLPADLVARVDAAAAADGLHRSTWIRQALATAVRTHEARERAAETV